MWGYYKGELKKCNNDYDIRYLSNGMEYVISDSTKTQKYTFGIAWIDDVGYDDTVADGKRDRGVETWYAADPSYYLQF